MDNNKNITVGELGKRLKSLEQEISPWAKAGMRAYTPDELIAYKTSITLIDFLQSKGLIDGKRMEDYWALHGPTQHRTIKESKPFDARGDEAEVFDKVLEKTLRGDSDIDDEMFLKEVEKRSGVKLLDEETKSVAKELKDIAERLDAIKKKIIA